MIFLLTTSLLLRGRGTIPQAHSDSLDENEMKSLANFEKNVIQSKNENGMYYYVEEGFHLKSYYDDRIVWYSLLGKHQLTETSIVYELVGGNLK